MTRWNLSIPEETDRAVRMHLARTGLGKKGDLSKFVTDSVRREIFDRTVKDIQDRNAQYGQDEILDLISEGVEWARADRS